MLCNIVNILLFLLYNNAFKTWSILIIFIDLILGNESFNKAMQKSNQEVNQVIFLYLIFISIECFNILKRQK